MARYRWRLSLIACSFSSGFSLNMEYTMSDNLLNVHFKMVSIKCPVVKSHISDVQRLSRLFIAACLAYIWIVYLGSVGEKDRWRSIIHRSERCDLSLFQLGLRLLEYFLNEELPIPVQFYVTI